jgi:uncharacterized protein YkwD
MDRLAPDQCKHSFRAGEVMRLFSLLAAMLMLLPFPPAVPGGFADKMPAAPKPRGFLTLTASVVLGPIAGPPKPVADRLVRMLDAASRRAGLALLNYEGAKGDYRLQGDMNAVREGSSVKLVYSWQVFDGTGAMAGSTSGSVPVPGEGLAPWGDVKEPALKLIAGQGIAVVTRQIKPDKPPTAGITAPVSPAAGSLTAFAKQHALSPASPAASSDYQTEIDANEALRLLNDYRKAKGLGPLKLDSYLTTAAAALTTDMAKHDRMSHLGPDDADLRKRLKAAGYNYMLAAENVGIGQKSLAELIATWKKDPSQSRTMLLPEAREMGIAYQYRPDTNSRTFWTLVVAAPL